MNPDDPRLQIAALALLQKAIADNTAALVENARRDKEADAKEPPDWARQRMGPESQEQYREKGVTQEADGRFTNTRQRAGGGDVGQRGGDDGGYRLVTGIERAVGSAFGNVGNLLAARFAAVLGPVAVFSQIIAQSGSGATVFTKSLQVLAASVAPILLPVFAVLAAGLVTLADTLWSKLLPALGGFYQFVVSHFLPAAGKMATSSTLTGTDKEDFAARGALGPFAASYEAFRASGLGKRALGAGERVARGLGIGDAGDALVERLGLGKVAQFNARVLGADDPTARAGRAGGLAGAGTAGEGGRPGAVAGPSRPDVNAVFRDVMKSLEMSMAPKASFGGIAQASRNVQLAALNSDPLDKRILEYTMRSFEELQRIRANTEPRVSGRWDTSGDF